MMAVPLDEFRNHGLSPPPIARYRHSMVGNLSRCILFIAAVFAGAASLCMAQTKLPPAGRAFHFAGGRMKSQVKLGENYSDGAEERVVDVLSGTRV